MRIADADRPAGDQRTQAIGNEAVLRPIAAADHIAGAYRGDADLAVGAGAAKRAAPGRRRQFGAGLAAAGNRRYPGAVS
jgi:hypothetical protein